MPWIHFQFCELLVRISLQLAGLLITKNRRVRLLNHYTNVERTALLPGKHRSSSVVGRPIP